jgi:carboxypeptidase Taq
MNPYFKFAAEIKEILHLQNAKSMLLWDQRCYMPPAGISQRGASVSILSRIIHEKITKMSNILELKKNPELSPSQQREIELFIREYDRRVKIPSELVVQLQKQSMLTEVKWMKAKQKSNFAMVQPELEKLIGLIKQKAEALDPSKDPWDTLVDDFEPKMTGDKIESLFSQVKDGVVSLIKKYDAAIADCEDVPRISVLDAPASLDQLQQMSQYALKVLNLPDTRLRLDESVHPFTSGYLDDVRLTTHYLPGTPMSSWFSTLHEAGHGIYDLNLPRDTAWMLRGESISSGIHESQSRFIENIIGKNQAFLEYVFPKFQELIPPYQAVSFYDFNRAVNSINPSKIRIYADEITYFLHIVMRFEIERDLFAGRIQVNELPQVWNEKMEQYLGQTINNDAEGVLQDTHWYIGYFGYFPSYALGNLYNAQMLNTMKHIIPEYEDLLRKGEVSPILSWLKTNVHEKGNEMDALPFIEKLSGERLNPHYFLDYAEMKFGKIYNF